LGCKVENTTANAILTKITYQAS